MSTVHLPEPPAPEFQPWRPFWLVCLDGEPMEAFTLRGKVAVEETRRAILQAKVDAAFTLRQRGQRG